MSDVQEIVRIKAGEMRVLRLFSLDLPPEHAKFLREPGAVAQLLGISDLDEAETEVFPVRDLEELGLSGYLVEGCGISPDQIDESALDGIKGWVLVLRSAALRGRSANLTLGPNVIPIGRYDEVGVDWSAKPIQTDSAKPFSAQSTPPRAARARAQRVGFTIFAIVMSLIIGGILWLVL